ncbi:biopolymer transporter ExbD [Acinetobacter baumannii]
MIAVIKMLKADKPDVKVIIAADKNVKYDIVMQVMDELKNNEIPVGLYTKPIK